MPICRFLRRTVVGWSPCSACIICKILLCPLGGIAFSPFVCYTRGMDSKSFVLLEHLFDLVGAHNLLILDAADLPTKGVDTEEVPALLEVLVHGGYLTLKYADRSEYCLGLTPQGRALVMEVRQERDRRLAAEKALEVSRARQAQRLQIAEAERVAERAVAEESREGDVTLSEEAASEEVASEVAQEAPTVPVVAPVRVDDARFSRKLILCAWLSAFCGALLGGGLVGLIMYILHVTLHN